MYFIAAATIVCLLHHVQSSDVRMPPKIVRGPILEKIFRSDEEIKLDCHAEGFPEPRYTWLKDGHVLEPKPNVQYLIDGIHITHLSHFDEGYYQCRAENQFGVSLSNTTALRRSYIGTYGPPAKNDYHGLEEGQPYVLKYQPLKCFPTPTFSWQIADSLTDNSPRTLATTKRIQIDDEGNLHFSYLLASDMQDSKLYKCSVLNPFVDLTVGGSYSRLFITPKTVRDFAPVRSFASRGPVVAVLGRNVTLRCFFSGHPDPSLTWTKLNGSLPIGRYRLDNHNTEIFIQHVRHADEGDYRCRASNSANGGSIADEIIQIDVQSAPSFARSDDRPSCRNVTEGESVTFTCNATAEPLANIVWLRNGVVLTPENMPDRMRIMSNGKQLTIQDVCKNCAGSDRDHDLMVIQCNASNVHGYVFSDAYVNVLKRTSITDPPQNAHLPHDALSADFMCVASTDDTTPLSIRWYRVMDDGSDDTLVRNTTTMVTVSADGTKLSFRMAEDTLSYWSKFRGKYRCHATNGHSEDKAECTLTVDDPPPPPTPPPMVETEEPETTTAGAASDAVLGASFADFWWLLVIAAAVLLFIIIVIICCICCRRCKGDTYFVDKKEKQDHKDPEKELQDSALQPYHRRDADPMKGSRASLGDSMRGDSDDEDELAEYGDIDAGKFTEDGSFIGDYATEQRKRGRAGDSFA